MGFALFFSIRVNNFSFSDFRLFLIHTCQTIQKIPIWEIIMSDPIFTWWLFFRFFLISFFPGGEEYHISCTERVMPWTSTSTGRVLRNNTSYVTIPLTTAPPTSNTSVFKTTHTDVSHTSTWDPSLPNNTSRSRKTSVESIHEGFFFIN